MKKIQTQHGEIAVLIEGTEIRDLWDMMDKMAEAMTSGCFGLVVHREDMPEGFFDLTTGVAGEILQKFSNYQMKIGIVGDYRNISSHALACFISESNRGRSVFFLDTAEKCVAAMDKMA